MATRYSQQLQVTQGQTVSSFRSGLNEVNAHRKSEFFKRNTTDAVNGNLAQNDVVHLARVPKGARIVGGVLKTGALGAGVTIKLGYIKATSLTASDAAFLAATSVAAISSTAFADTEALNYGLEADEDLIVTATIEGAAPAGDKNILGEIHYLKQ